MTSLNAKLLEKNKYDTNMDKKQRKSARNVSFTPSSKSESDDDDDAMISLI